MRTVTGDAGTARIATHCRLSLSSRVRARCFRAMWCLHHRCVKLFYGLNAGFCNGRSYKMREERAAEHAPLQPASLGRRPTEAFRRERIGL